jgi:hypothetical protein
MAGTISEPERGLSDGLQHRPITVLLSTSRRKERYLGAVDARIRSAGGARLCDSCASCVASWFR